MNIKAFEKNNNILILVEKDSIQYGALFINNNYIKSGSFVSPDESYEEVLLEDFHGKDKELIENTKRYFESYLSLKE